MQKSEIFQNSEIKLLEPICSFRYEDDFIVYQSARLPFYRLANGIFILQAGGRTLEEWERIFDRYFNYHANPHRTFTFIHAGEFDFLKQQALAARWQEVKTYPLEMCMRNAYEHYTLPGAPKICQITNDRDWEKYRLFKKELHDDYWATKEGFGVVRHISESLDMERFYLEESATGRMTSTLALLKNGMAIRIENVETHPEHRRKHLALHLLIFAIQRSFRELGAEAVILNAVGTDASRNLYKKLGFKTMGEKVLLMSYQP